MRTRALMPGVLWNVRDTSPPTPRKPPKPGHRKGIGPKSTAEGLVRAGHVLWLHEQGGNYREISDVTGYPYSFVYGVLSCGRYLNAKPTPFVPNFNESTDAAAASAATT